MAKTSLNLPNSFKAIDLETTGLSSEWCEIIEAAVVTVKDDEVVDTVSMLVKPKNPIPAFISSLTGITDAMVSNAPSIEDVAPRLAAILNNSTVVGHNVCFDNRFLQRAFSDSGISCNYTMVDTLRMSRHVFPDLESHSLPFVADACGIYVGFCRHRAEIDAKDAAHCAIAMRSLVFEKYGDNPDAAVSRISRGLPPKPGDLTPTVDKIDESNPFYGSTVLFTGKLSGMTRATAMQKAVNLGAVPVNNFSAKVDFLVVGSFDFCSTLDGEASGKMKKAQRAIEGGAAIQIMSEDFFLSFANEV